MLFAHFVTLGLARVSGFNRMADMWAGLAFRLLTLFVVHRLIREAVRDRALPAGVLTLAASGLLFSPVGFQTWFEGLTSVGWNLGGLCMVVVVWAMTRRPLKWRDMAVSALATTVGLYSLGVSLLLPFVGFAGLLLAIPTTRLKAILAKLLAWASFSGVALALYFQGLTARDGVHQSGLGFLGANLERVVRYSLAYLGGPLVFGTTHQLPAFLGAAGGVLFLTAAAVVMRRQSEPFRSVAPWLMMVLFAGGNALATALGRLPLLPNVDTVVRSNRYTTISAFFWISVVVMTVLAAETPASRDQATVRDRPVLRWSCVLALLSPLMLLQAGAMRRACSEFGPTSSTLRAGRLVLTGYRTSSDEVLSLVHPAAAIPRARAATLERLGLGPFRDTGVMLGYVDAPAGQSVVCAPLSPDGVTVRFEGACEPLARIDLDLRSSDSGPDAVAVAPGEAGTAIAELRDEESRQTLFRGTPNQEADKDRRASLLFPPLQRSRGRSFALRVSRPSEHARGACLGMASPAPDRELEVEVRQGCVVPSSRRTVARLARPAPPVREARLFMDDEVRAVIAAHPPSRLSWSLLVPSSGSLELKTAVALPSEVWDKPECDGVTFKVAVLPNGQPRIVLFERHVDPSHAVTDRNWLPVDVSLGRFAGRSITLLLETEAGPAANYSYDWAVWALPVLEDRDGPLRGSGP
jgi:hypothetical protein